MLNLDKAVHFLTHESYTCVFCKEEATYTSENRGIYALVRFLSGKVDLKGFSAADRVVGKAAALLMVLAGVTEVFAPVMSEQAIYILSYYGIFSRCDYTVPEILNKDRTEICPLEQCVSHTKSPETALQLIKSVLKNIETI